MRTMAARFCIICLGFCWAAAFLPAQTRDGAARFKKFCASCHEAGGESRAPRREILRQMPPEHTLEALESGLMIRQGQQLSRAQRHALAEFLGLHHGC